MRKAPAENNDLFVEFWRYIRLEFTNVTLRSYMQHCLKTGRASKWEHDFEHQVGSQF